MSCVSVSHLSKTYAVHQKNPGFAGALGSLVRRKYENIKAVDDISFQIEEGEFIGFIGPNGAGKTTTLKCLSGLLYPTNGSVTVLGHVPSERKSAFLKQIALVMGQKNQLWWDLPAIESFELNKEIYDVSDRAFKTTLADLTELLDVKGILNVQVRRLSLGQRMKCELIAALIHSPKVLFLDEPTIGLDVVMQKNLRDFIKQYNKKFNATIILTSHYMEDVRQLCERVIIIDHGKILYDGMLDDIVKKYSKEKFIEVVFKSRVPQTQLKNLGKILEQEGTRVRLEVARGTVNKVAANLLEDFAVEDLIIEEPKLEDMVRDIFSHGLNKGENA